MKQEIWRNYPVGSKVELVERLLGPGALAPNQGDWGLLTLFKRAHTWPMLRVHCWRRSCSYVSLW